MRSWLKISCSLFLIIGFNCFANLPYTSDQQKHIDVARTLIKTNQYDRALFFYKDVLAQRPNDTDLLIEIARVNGWAGHHQQAIELLNKVLRIAPQRRYDVLRPLGWQWLENGNPDKSITYFKEYLNKYPGDNDATSGLKQATQLANQTDLQIARMLVEKKKYPQSLPYYEKALSSNPYNPDLIIEVAFVNGWAKHHARSAQLYQRVIQIQPARRNDVLKPLAQQLLWSNQPRQAAPYIKEYLKLHPNESEANTILKNIESVEKQQIEAETLTTARKYADQKNYQKALIYYYQTLQTNPNNSDLLIETARVEGWSGNPLKAIQLLQQVLKIAPQRRQDVLRPLGWQLTFANQPEKAIPLFKEYLAKHPRDTDATNGLHNAYLTLARQMVGKKQHIAALSYYYKVLQHKPNDPDLLIETARVEGWAGNYETAINLYQRVLLVAPQRRDDVLRPLAWQYIWNKQPELAEPLFTEYLSEHHGDWESLLGLGYVFEQKNFFKEALQLYRWSIRQKSDLDNIDAYYGEARVLLDMNRFAEAEKKYCSLLQRKPGDEGAMSGLARTHNWMGSNRRAASEYEILVSQYPENMDYKLSLAWAQYWAGFNDLAYHNLIDNNIPGEDAAALRWRTKKNLGNPFGADYGNASDSDGLVVNAYNVNGGYKINENETIGGIYRLANFNQNDTRVIDHEYWLTWSDRFGDLDVSSGTHWPYVAIGSRTYGSWQTFGWHVWDKWIPADKWRFDFDAKNEVIENVPSILNQVLYTRALASFDYQPYPRVLFSTGGIIGEFNDNNVRKRIINRLQYNIFYFPKVYIAVEDNYFTDSNPDISRGYYNPAYYREGRVVAGCNGDIVGWEFGGFATQGRFQENPGTPGDLNSYELYFGRDMKDWGNIRFYYGRTNSVPSLATPSAGPIGYRRTYLGLVYYNYF